MLAAGVEALRVTTSGLVKAYRWGRSSAWAEVSQALGRMALPSVPRAVGSV